MRRRVVDPGHRSKRSMLLALGVLFAIPGLILTVIAFVDFFGAFGGHGRPTKFWMGFVGMPLLGIGFGMIRFALIGALARFTAGEITPVARDVVDDMAHGTQGSVRTIARAVRDGLRGDDPAAARCPSCHTDNDAEARFCDSCGGALARACTSCGADNDGDASFCKRCGAQLSR